MVSTARVAINSLAILFSEYLPNAGLTQAQARVFNYIKQYIEKHDRSPSHREIGKALKISHRAAQDHIKYIKKKGYIYFDESVNHRKIRINETTSMD